MNVRERLQALLDGKTLKSCDGYAMLRDGLLHSTLSTGTASIFNAGDNYFRIKPRLGTFMEAVDWCDDVRERHAKSCHGRTFCVTTIGSHFICTRGNGSDLGPTVEECEGQWELL